MTACPTPCEFSSMPVPSSSRATPMRSCNRCPAASSMNAPPLSAARLGTIAPLSNHCANRRSPLPTRPATISRSNANCVQRGNRSRISRKPLAAWWNQTGRGVVVLPTGTGKTFVALLAIAHVGRPTLVITPTIPLMNQWYGEMLAAFGGPIGLIGGGYYDFQPLTVTTYDSAYIYLERWGNRFGLIVFDECHHLPSPSYQFAAIGSLAPYRLGLTATPERADGGESLYPGLIGPIVYRREIKQLAGDFLAEYRVERIDVDLSHEEMERYQQARTTYRKFVTDNGISMGSPQGWQRFLQLTVRLPDGRAAFQAYREQKRLSLAAPAKIELLDELLHRHALDRTIIFAYDNASVYQIARRFLTPAITHQTKTRERQQILQRFHSGAVQRRRDKSGSQ